MSRVPLLIVFGATLLVSIASAQYGALGGRTRESRSVRGSGFERADALTDGQADTVTAGGEPAATEAHPFVLGLGVGVTSFVTDTWRKWDSFSGTSMEIGGGAGFDGTLELGSHVASWGCHPGLFVGGRLAFLGSGNLQAADASLRLGLTAQVFAIQGLRILAGPTLAVGPTLTFGQSAFMLNIEVGGELHTVLADGMFGIWLRPFSVELQFWQYFLARWELLVGVEARL